MPEWFKALCILLLLVGFIFYAFRQGFRVKPGPKQDNDSGYIDSGHH